MAKNRFDSILEKMLDRIERVSTKMASEFKGTNPFDKESVSKKQLQYNFSQLTPEMQESLRQSLGDEAMDDFTKKIGGQ